MTKYTDVDGQSVEFAYTSGSNYLIGVPTYMYTERCHTRNVSGRRTCRHLSGGRHGLPVQAGRQPVPGWTLGLLQCAHQNQSGFGPRSGGSGQCILRGLQFRGLGLPRVAQGLQLRLDVRVG